MFPKTGKSLLRFSQNKPQQWFHSTSVPVVLDCKITPRFKCTTCDISHLVDGNIT